MTILLLFNGRVSADAVTEAKGEGTPRRVLVLHAYHQGYEWTDAVHQGLMNGLDLGPDDVLQVEYLDLLRHSSPAYVQALSHSLRLKMLDKPPDLIVVSDDPALAFLRTQFPEFHRLPVVFCGINNYDPQRYPEFHHITGVNEAISVHETLGLALRLRPLSRRLAVVSGVAETEKRNLSIFREAAGSIPETVELLYLDGLEQEELMAGLSSLTADDIVIYLGWLSTPSGHTLKVSESVTLVRDASLAPVFGLWDFLLPYGVIGGKVVHGTSQGFAASDLANRVMAGELPEDIPVQMVSPNQMMFNEKELQRFGLQAEALPANSILVARVADETEKWRESMGNTYFSYELFAKHGSYMWIVDADTGVILDANDAVVQAYGYPGLVGMHVWDVNELDEAFMRKQMHGVKAGAENRFQFRHMLADGRVIDVQVDSYPITVGGRTVLFSIIHDITDKLAAETALAMRNRILFLLIGIALVLAVVTIGVLVLANHRRRVSELEALRQKEQLEQARDAAEQALETQKRFLANMSHEIRTPMNGFLGMIQLLGMSPLNTEQQAWLALADKSSQALMSVLNDILEMSRLDAGKVNLRLAAYRPVNLLYAVRDMFSLAAKQKSLEIRVSVKGEVPDLCEGDELRIKQILDNLVGNALKFTKTGYVQLSLLAACQPDDPRVRLTYVVADTGIGIAPELHERIFEPFSQVEAQWEHPHEGSGLGLAICRGLARLMGGDITVESEPGKGSRFSFQYETRVARDQ